MQQRAKWSSERAFVFSTAAAAVGLGNLWRFPYMAGDNGGAAFIIAYLIAAVILGFPIMVLEIGVGRAAQGSPVRTFRRYHRLAPLFGWVVVGLTGIILSYYLVITGWTLGYAARSVTGRLVGFEEFTAGYISLWLFFVVAIVAAGVLVRGVEGIEKTTTVLMPVLIVIVIGLAAFGLTQAGAGEAMRFMFSPDFGALASPSMWLFAFGQAFYSLAVGQGYLITYGSHLPDKVNLPRAAGSVAVIETAIALLAGLMIFPMVFTVGLAPDEGSELAFNTLPRVFEVIPGGAVLGAVFFVLFFLAALSSCIAGLKVVVTAVKEEFALSQARAVVATIVPVVVLGVPSALSFTPVQLSLAGRPFLEVVDLFAATQIVVASGIIGGALISWLVPRERLVEKMGVTHEGAAWWMITAARYLPIPVLILLLVTLVL